MTATRRGVTAGGREALVAGLAALSGGPSPGAQAGSTSDLSIDEILLLHSAGWEPLDLVSGVAVMAVPPYVWNWGQGEITEASTAYGAAFSLAADRLGRDCDRAGGDGVVGVKVDVDVSPHHIEVALAGTAIGRAGGRPPGAHGAPPFVSDLSGRDFTLLSAAGWMPLGLAFGASFVYVPRRSASTALQQTSQNVELTNFTQAMYASREAAMGRMQQAALRLSAKGVVDVQITEGPMGFARHAVGFATWGTAVRLGEGGHRHIEPQMVMTLDDAVVEFEAVSLRGDGKQ